MPLELEKRNYYCFVQVFAWQLSMNFLIAYQVVTPEVLSIIRVTLNGLRIYMEGGKGRRK